MKKQRLTEAQIVSILKQYDGGRDPMELCREYGISKATLYNWRKKYVHYPTTGKSIDLCKGRMKKKSTLLVS